ncbi:MAG: F0F1 ATP synthase subunit B [Flavobacteriia bacterium]|nr:F0F1 ATP synthase subunit B [Flavobacteriia bacterium]
MELITPDFGLLFWTGITFCLLMFILAKFVWKPVLNAVNARSQKIDEALLEAEKARQEMKSLHAENERILKEARAERDGILKEAKEASTRMIDDAREKAKGEGSKLIEAAKTAIASERNAAIADMKAQIASFSVQIAEQIVKESLSSDDKQKALASKMAEEIKLN